MSKIELHYPTKNPVGSRLVDVAVIENPTVSSLSIARTLFRRYPLAWPTIDACRMQIRHRRGAASSKQRASAQRSGALIGVTPPTRYGPLGIPEAQPEQIEPWIMDGCENVIILGDFHFPYHHPKAIELALNYGTKNGVDGILINGDLLDCYTLSRFEKDMGCRTFKEERDITIDFLCTLRALFPNARIVFKPGNHDDRAQSYILPRIPEFIAGATREEIPNLQSLLGLDNLGIEMVPRKCEVKLGDLYVLHGHELPKGMTSSVNPARGTFLRTVTSTAVHHHHRTSEHIERAMDGRLIGCWSIACLCQLRPMYEPNNKWNLGFARVEVANDGAFHMDNRKIHKGHIL